MDNTNDIFNEKLCDDISNFKTAICFFALFFNVIYLKLVIFLPFCFSKKIFSLYLLNLKLSIKTK